MEAKDLIKPGAVVLGIAAAAALGFAVGYLLARRPELFRRSARALAGGFERVSGALAESREELADLWAEARADARAAVEDEAFEAAAPAAAAAVAAAAERPEPAPDRGARGGAPRKPRPRRAPAAAG